MPPRRAHRWLIWFLPLFAARALIPFGYMLAPAQGALQLVLCSGQGAMVAPFAEQANAHAQPGHADHTAHHSGAGLHEHSVCPFALAGMAALAHADVVTPHFVERGLAPLPADTDRPPFTRPHRAHPIRGPPAA